MSADTEPNTNVNSENNAIEPRKWTLWRSFIAYWILGLCNNYGYVVMLTAAHDILKDINGDEFQNQRILSNEPSNVTTTPLPIDVRECNHVSTGAILLADIIPALVIKFTAPFLPFYVHVRVAICIALAASGFILVAFANTEALAIAGVIVTSLSSGFGEVSFLQYSSFFNKNVVSTWSSGTGGAGILGSISYAGLANLGLRTALLIMLIVPALMAIAFWIILPAPDPENAQIAIQLEMQEHSNNKEPFLQSLFFKMKQIPALFKFMIPLGLVYLFEYFINQGLFELIKFDNIFLSGPHQYHWLQVDYQLGVFLSRSSVNIFHVRKIWLMGVLQFLNVIIFTCESIFYFIPSIWIVFALTLWEGVLGGAAYVNTFYKISQEIPEDKKQFSMSVTSLSDTIGITFAGIVALPVHNAICSLPKPERLTF